MATITASNKQVRLIQDALELYSRVGILQLKEILSHPSLEMLLEGRFTPKKPLEVGDETMRGEIVEITKKHIKTKGSWGNGEEIKTWTDVENIRLSPDYGELHKTKQVIEELLTQVKYEITGNPEFKRPGVSFGICNTKDLGKTNDEAFDMIQVIRHEFWKENPNRSDMSVASSVSKFSSEELIKVGLDK